VRYRPSIIYGNPHLGIPSLQTRVNQNRASGRRVTARCAVQPAGSVFCVLFMQMLAPFSKSPLCMHACL
jgi:hypothetical protein